MTFASSPPAHGPWLVLIGPAGAGKSTLGLQVAEMTGRSFVDIDIAGRPFYEEQGWPVARIYEESARLGWVPTERAWEKARAHAVEQVLLQSGGAVVALGAAHTNYVEDALFDRVKHSIQTAEHIVWVEPHGEPTLSLAQLRARNIAGRDLDYLHDGHDMLQEWVLDQRAKGLATHAHYTDGFTPRQSAQHIVSLLGA